MKTRAKIEKALMKKALGFQTTELSEEYVCGEDNEIRLSKKRVTKKNVPPDLAALKMLEEQFQGMSSQIEELADKELQEEIERLVEMIAKEKKHGNQKK